MEIRNFTQFINLLNVTGAINSHPAFLNLSTCLSVYNSMCSCGGDSSVDKTNKHGDCNRIYRESMGAVDSIKANLFQRCNDNTISFYIDDLYHLKTISR